MCILNPYLGKETLKATPGVVVIDELDLSLHPTWQKRIVRILKELFPKVQFICATHSPFIIQSLEPGELITLDTILDEEYSGQSIEDIAEDIMNVPLVQYSEKKVKMYQAAFKRAGFDFLGDYACPEDAAGAGLLIEDMCHELSKMGRCFWREVCCIFSIRTE